MSLRSPLSVAVSAALGDPLERSDKGRSCERKKRWAKKRDAKVFLARMKNQYGDEGMGIYRCDFCSGWHMGHHIRRVKAAAAAGGK